MSEKVFMLDNDLVWRNCERLYMDSKTSDVNFVFTESETDYSEIIPAHKILLSTTSSVFEAMFYGPLTEEGNILIVDATAAAFKEFLQFFYLSEVRLTSENIGEVVNLCNKYELLEGLKVCEVPLQNSLTNSDLCWGYEVGILFGLENLRRFCERQIQENAQEILASETFLSCNRKSVEKIINLVESRCCAQMIIEACMEWTKAECSRKNLEESSANLRIQLGDLFTHLIQTFDQLSIQQFFDYTSNYREIITDSEMDSIIKIISLKLFQSSIYRDCPLSILPKLICDRRSIGETEIHEMEHAFTSFESNKTILLREIYLPQLAIREDSEDIQSLDVIYTIYGPFNIMRGELIVFEKVKLSFKEETRVVLPQPIVIEGCKGYVLNVIGTHYDLMRGSFYIQSKQFETPVVIGDGIEISFYPESLVSTRLVFQSPTI